MKFAKASVPWACLRLSTVLMALDCDDRVWSPFPLPDPELLEGSGPVFARSMPALQQGLLSSGLWETLTNVDPSTHMSGMRQKESSTIAMAP